MAQKTMVDLVDGDSGLLTDFGLEVLKKVLQSRRVEELFQMGVDPLLFSDFVRLGIVPKLSEALSVYWHSQVTNHAPVTRHERGSCPDKL